MTRSRHGHGLRGPDALRDPAADLAADPDLFEVLLDDDPSDEFLDLDKAWHGLHWLLTGTADDTDTPAGQAILGGTEIGEDKGYGPSRLLRPDAYARR